MGLFSFLGDIFAGDADEAAARAGQVLATNAGERREQAEAFQSAALGDLDAGQLRAETEITGARDQAIDALSGADTAAVDALTPFSRAGAVSLDALKDLLGLTDGVDPTEALRATPGFQFALETGQEAIDRSSAARGSLNSGRTLKELTRFGQGVADQTFSSRVQQLAALAEAGRGASTNIAAIRSQGGANKANVISTAGTNRAQTILGTTGNRVNVRGTALSAITDAIRARGEAEAGGIVGAANARQAGLQNLFNLAGTVSGAALGNPVLFGARKKPSAGSPLGFVTTVT